jgi:hypothetical protein
MTVSVRDDQLMSSLIGAYAEVSMGLLTLQDYIGERRSFEQRLSEAIRAVPIPAQEGTVSGGAVTILNAGNILGPGTGYAWAISRVTASGLATGDTVSVYRGPAVAATVNPNNLLNVLTAAAPSWQPGRTGCIINAGDTLVLNGTGLSATTVMLTGEAIIMESWLLPHFLL